jgi:signal transduction histidine kinase
MMTEATLLSSIKKIAHEFANSVNTISSTVQLLESYQPVPATELLRELITILNLECNRMQIQVKELHQLAKRS